jgi:hypothetical protein
MCFLRHACTPCVELRRSELSLVALLYAGVPACGGDTCLALVAGSFLAGGALAMPL